MYRHFIFWIRLRGQQVLFLSFSGSQNVMDLVSLEDAVLLFSHETNMQIKSTKIKYVN